MQPPQALYIHIPFCRRKCPYCDFYSVAGRDDLHAAYADALIAELREARVQLGSLSLRSVFLGGGTPTALPVSMVAQLLEACGDLLTLSPQTEVTCECNPGTVTADDLRALRAAGVSRLSIGIQSPDDSDLRFLERIHTAAEAERTVGDARDAGFDSLSLDLIYALPGQTPAAWQATLSRAISLEPDHISAYILQVEDETPLAERVDSGECEPLSDDEQADLFHLTHQSLTGAGFEQYEISNFARAGHQCRHNLTYWRNEPYLGLGASAWSFVEGERRRNVPDVEAYVRAWSDGLPCVSYSEHCLGPAAANETLMMGLRLVEGLSLEALTTRHGVDLTKAHASEIARLADGGLARVVDGRLALTPRGMCVAAEIIALLALDEEE